jgi:hypothetical protein
MNWFNNFSGGFNNRSNYGAGNSGWSGNYVGGWGNSGAYSGSTATLPNLNTQSTNYYGANFTGNNLGSSGFNNGNTGWGNRSNESGRYYNYANQRQPYDEFLVCGFNLGYAQNNLVATRNRRRDVEQTIDSIGQVGFWGRGPGYPLSLYGLSQNG